MSVRQLLVVFALALALLAVPSAIADPPTLTGVPSSFTASVDGPGPYPVFYSTPSANDTENGPVPVSCDTPSGSNFPYGDTLVTCSATDPTDLPLPTTTSGSFTVTVKDTTAPSLSLPSPVIEVVGSPVSTTVNYTATQNDAGTVSAANCLPATGAGFPYGSTTVNCTATDSQGNTQPGSFIVKVQDTIKPTVTPPANVNVTVPATPVAVAYTNATATEGAAATCAPLSGSSFPAHVTTVTCSATDAAGNTGTATFTVTVTDNVAPTITVPAPITQSVNNATSAIVTYTATSTEGLVPTCTPPSGSSFALGVTTPVTCTATDPFGNTGSGTFTVTVTDTTPPVVAITGGPSGTTGSRAASFDFTTSEGATSCELDGGGFSACGSPSTYSGLADGTHTFNVKAVDAGNNSATASRSWTIDATPPVLSLPETIYAEANGPAGAQVGFTVTASDGGGALLPVAVGCTPGSGALFPLGKTTVECTVADAAGNRTNGSFVVVVQDTTAPAINAPNVSFTATSAAGAKKTDPDVAAYLAGVSATDLVSTPMLDNDMPDALPIGKTTVVFTAKDEAGNVAKKSVTVTVLAVGQKAPPPDFTPPGDVIGATAKPGDRLVTLSWKPPLAKDVAYVAVTESVVGEAGAGRPIYKGLDTTVTAKGLVNRKSYRFLIIAFDKAGNRSKGVVLLATPKAEALTSPKQAQRVAAPPLLRWAPVPGATYYNVQLWRGSTKLLSTWPVTTGLQLTAKWTFSGKAQKLTPGLYTWYVWPGVGPRADAHYGSLLGSRTFTYLLPKAKPKK